LRTAQRAITGGRIVHHRPAPDRSGSSLDGDRRVNASVDSTSECARNGARQALDERIRYEEYASRFADRRQRRLCGGSAAAVRRGRQPRRSGGATALVLATGDVAGAMGFLDCPA
jgi:hypothetical protein